MTCIELCYRSKTLYHTEKRGFGYLGFQKKKKSKTHPPKPAEVEPSFRKVSLLPTKLRMLFHAHLWVREFWRILQSTVWPHQSTTRPLVRAASHIKVTRPPCLFWFPPWEDVNRSTTLIHRMWVTSFINYSRKKLRDCCVSYLNALQKQVLEPGTKWG